MSNLQKFKRFLTFGDVADNLSKVFNEEVKQIDVERLVVDGHIVASVIADDWHCFILKYGDVKKAETSEGPVEIIKGVYRIDLAELESNFEYVTIELNNGCKAACYSVDHSKNERSNNASPAIKKDSSSIESIYEKINKRFESLPKTLTSITNDNAYIKPNIGIECVVIQPVDLEAFILKANEGKPEKPLDHRERASMEQIILALAKEANYKLVAPYSDAETLALSAATNGVELPTIDTVAKFLKAAVKHDTNRKPS